MTVRLQPEMHDRLRAIAEAEHRSVAAYLELLVARDLAEREDAERVIRVHVAPELRDVLGGEVLRERGESTARHERRAAVLGRLLAGR